MKASDKFTFGKYKGERLRAIIKKDKPYVQWCINTIKDFKLSPTMQELMDSMSEAEWNDGKEEDYEQGY